MSADTYGPAANGDTVRSVDVFLVDSGTTKNWLFLKMMTAEGVIGWGECYTAPDREPAIASIVCRLSEYLVGRHIYEIRPFLLMAFRDVATLRGSMEFFAALSGLELALWDIIGKHLGQPIYNLLGGPVQRRFRLYANGWCYKADGELEELPRLLDAASELVESGFKALKIDPFPGPWRAYPAKSEIVAGIAVLEELRDKLGPDVDILVEGHRRFAPSVACQIAAMLEPLEPFWFEEPVPSSNLPGLLEVQKATAIPVVTGEDLYTLTAFREVFERRAANIVNPDVGCCGGILELMAIATAANTYMVLVAPHCYNSTSVALAATLHAAAMMPNFLIMEYFVNFAERSASLMMSSSVVIEGGFAGLGSHPGHGIELDEQALRRAAGHPVRRSFPGDRGNATTSGGQGVKLAHRPSRGSDRGAS
jgi:galactonate dehydratase